MDRRKTKRTVAALLIFLLLLLLLSLVLSGKAMMNQNSDTLTVSTDKQAPVTASLSTQQNSSADKNNAPQTTTLNLPNDPPSTTNSMDPNSSTSTASANFASPTTPAQITNQNSAHLVCPPCNCKNNSVNVEPLPLTPPPSAPKKNCTPMTKKPAPIITESSAVPPAHIHTQHVAISTTHAEHHDTLGATHVQQVQSVAPVNDLKFEKNSLSPMRESNRGELPFTPVSKKWYVEFEVARTTLNLPTYFLPLTMGSWDAFEPFPPPETLSRGLALDNSTWLPEIKIGYNLDAMTLSPRWCGKPSIEVSYSQFYTSKNVNTNFSEAPGVAWKINEKEAPLYGLGSKNILNTTIRGSVRYQSGSIDFKNKMSSNPAKYMCVPSAGVVYTALNQRYTYAINAITQNVGMPITTTGNSSLLAKYAGLALGDRFNLNFTPRFAWFVDGKIHLLRADTTLVTNQIPDSSANPLGPFSDFRDNVRITSRDIRATYRALLSTGVNFYFTGVEDPNSIQLGLSLGIDQWGFVPQSVTVTSLDAREPHILARAMRDYFASIGLIIPIV